MRLGLAALTIVAASAGAVLWLPDMLSQSQLAVVTEVGEGGVARVAVPTGNGDRANADADGPPRFFGFALPRTTAEPAKPAAIVAPEPRLATQPAAAPQLVTVVAPPPVLALPREMPRAELARDLQRELKRVGCYAGEVDGSWGPGSKRAAQSFMHHINSAVPTDEPDLVQLTLVRSFAGTACAAPCPPDRMVPGTSRCLPVPVLAARPQTRPIEAYKQDAPPASPALASGPATRTHPLPMATARPGPVQYGTAPPHVAVVPLEGRMAVGGPPVPAAPGVGAQPPTGVQIAPPPSATREVKQVRQRVRPRRDRNWTATFFDR